MNLLIVDDPYVLFGVSDGGAHTKFLTAGRYPTETLCKVVRQHGMIFKLHKGMNNALRMNQHLDLIRMGIKQLPGLDHF